MVLLQIGLDPLPVALGAFYSLITPDSSENLRMRVMIRARC
jgi:hypothetical protein